MGRNRGRDYEDLVAEDLERQGHKVLRKGWPDLLVVTKDEGTFAVEVKSGQDARLSEHQKEMHTHLGDIGLEVHTLHYLGRQFSFAPTGLEEMFRMAHDMRERQNGRG